MDIKKIKNRQIRIVSQSNIWRFGRYLRPYWHYMFISFIAGLVRMIFPLFLPYFMQQVIDTVVLPKGLSHAVRIENLIPLLWLTALIFVVHGIASIGRFYFSNIAAQNAVKRIRSKLFACIQRQSISFFQERPTGTIVSRVISDIASTEQIFDIIFIQNAQHILQGGAILVILFSKDITLGLVAFGMVPLFMIATRIISSRMRRVTSRAQEVLAGLSGFLTENFTNIKVVQAFTREEREKASFTEKVDIHKQLRLRLAWFTGLLTSCSELVTGLGRVIIICLCAWKVLQGRFTVGEMTAFVFYTTILYTPIQHLSMKWGQIQQAEACADRVFEFMDKTPTIKDKPGAKPLKVIKGEIGFENVNFSYPQDQPIITLKNIDVHIPGGTRAALVGVSGAGKSTLVNLIPRFFEVDSGRILIDGQDINKVTYKSLREAISIVPQESMLFSGTIKENIQYGRPDSKEKEIHEAANAANAEEFILDMERGYNSIIGEQGTGLSGGQIQRIAIARAFLKNSPIIILDEATSALDSHSEGLIREALVRLLTNRTSITIAHRLSTVYNADIILVMQDGEIVERGRHEELLELNGVYTKLVTGQLMTS